MIEFDPYEILNLSPDVTPEEIKNAYRRVARRLHPDTNHHAGAETQFQEITQAYELLIDPDKRRSYDKLATQESRQFKYRYEMRAIPSKRTIQVYPETQVLYILSEIMADPNADEQQQQSRLNLTLVLDKSKSMSGTRLERVKAAAHQIIDKMKPEDILSVVSFNDYEEVVIEANTVQNKPSLKAKISMISASGGTEIFNGLQAGIQQNRKYLAPRLVNHVVLITDGNTYGDEKKCLSLAKDVTKQGIGISALGIGTEWNDVFLDELVGITGGTSSYIRSLDEVGRFMNNHVYGLADLFAERVQISIAPDPDIRLENVFRLSPSLQPLAGDTRQLALGGLPKNRHISVMFQLELPGNLALGQRSIARVATQAEIFSSNLRRQYAYSDISIHVSENPTVEEPPQVIMDALGKLTLYRMQERAQEALENGDIETATRTLANLSTRLLEIGEGDLANTAREELKKVVATSRLSIEGKKALKYQTRYLMNSETFED